MARIHDHHTSPIRHGSVTHRPVKLTGLRAPIATKPVPEQPQETSSRVTAGQQARLARALRNNRVLVYTR